MRISLNWLKKYVDIKVPDDELVRLIGARLVEVEGVIDETHKYDNIYIVKVAKAEKIPDTHLTLCQIDVGKPELVQVVCGAPNVKVGMLAIWIAPGAVVPASMHEDAPFVIGKRKMLGKYESNGMLAGADELDFDDKHEKIAEIDPVMAQPGDLLADVFELRDLILDIENKSLTHRPDCFGVIGFAREVAGILGEKFNEPAPEEVATLFKPSKKSADAIKISIDDPDICARYTALVLEKHGELKAKYLSMQDILLSKSGMRPIDPIVDATNYLMLLTGQPLHAFDYDKFVAVGAHKDDKSSAQPVIGVRLAKEGEQLTLLDSKEVTLNHYDIVITSGDQPVALAGAMGGLSTAIDDTTRKIILESATFSLYNLRKTQMAHGIFSEAITRFTKGQPPYQTLAVARECATLLKAGFEVVGEADMYPHLASENVVKITTDAVNELLGTDFSAAKITRTLENVGLHVTANANKPEMNVAIPAWRTDLHIKEDIIEEVGRLTGYDNIQPVVPLHQTASKNLQMSLRTELRNLLARLGANEVLTYSFVAGRLLEKAGLDLNNSYRIVNSISPDLQYVRQSIVPSLLDKAYLNQKIPFDKFALFEMNKVYEKAAGFNDENVPVEKVQLGFMLAERKNDSTAYYKAKKFVERIMETLDIAVEFRPLKTAMVMARPFEPRRSAEIVAPDGEILGVVGEFRNAVRRNFKLSEYLAGFELDLEVLLRHKGHQHGIRDAVVAKRDFTISTDKTYAATIAAIRAIFDKRQLEVDITPLGIYQPEGAKKVNISVHLEFHQSVSDEIMSELESLAL